MSPCYECEYWIPLFLDEMVKLDEFEANKHCEECSAVSASESSSQVGVVNAT